MKDSKKENNNNNYATTSSNVFIHGVIGSIKDKSDDNKKMAILSIATHRKNQEKESITMWHTVVCYDINAENAIKYLKPKDYVSITGEIENWNEHDDESGNSIIKANYISYQTDSFISLVAILVDISQEDEEDEDSPVYLTLATTRKKKDKNNPDEYVEHLDYHKAIVYNKKMIAVLKEFQNSVIGDRVVVDGSLYVERIKKDNSDFEIDVTYVRVRKLKFL